jgi:UrcA family protein
MNVSSARSASWKRPIALSAVLAAALLAIVAAAPANAATRAKSDPPQIRIRYAHADLQTDAGALGLYKRIVAAARRVCSADYGRDLQYWEAVRACRVKAVEQAVHRVGSERLAAIHAARTPRTRAA